MTRYYFDYRRGDAVFPDDEGMELFTIETVQQEAVYAIADLARDAIRRNPEGSGHAMAIEVRDDDGPVLQVRLHWRVDGHKQR